MNIYFLSCVIIDIKLIIYYYTFAPRSMGISIIYEISKVTDLHVKQNISEEGSVASYIILF